VALLDADHGLLVINPSRAEISMVRREREPSAHPAPPEVDQAVD
jgi:hypothetical protein